MLEEFFSAKKKLYPQKIKGKFRKIKYLLNTIFLTIYFFAPFLRFNRDNAANQAILFDIPNSRLYFFAIEIWPEEIYYLAAILIIAATMLFFVTSLFGRIWCGYACFQTVWSDIFLAIEEFFQGSRNDRIILDRKNSFTKFYKKFLTHFCWILFSLITAIAFISYFNDVFLLIKNLKNFTTSITIYLWIIGITLSTYIMAGFAREHVCIYMCPYSRFQSAMFDKDTLIIGYDKARGEPRGKHKNGDSFVNRGHCIDCKQCVIVCPQGIDIRNGLQMECIACGLCIDACDDVMTKMNLPKGLIRYDTEYNLEKKSSNNKNNKFKILRPKTIYYSLIISVTVAILCYNLIHKTEIAVKTIADRNPIFVRLSDGSIRNGYLIKISNKTNSEKNLSLKLISPQNAIIKAQNEVLDDISNIKIEPRKTVNLKIFITINNNFIAQNNEMMIDLSLLDKQFDIENNLKLIFMH